MSESTGLYTSSRRPITLGCISSFHLDYRFSSSVARLLLTRILNLVVRLLRPGWHPIRFELYSSSLCGSSVIVVVYR